jgi:hypothetical protein
VVCFGVVACLQLSLDNFDRLSEQFLDVGFDSEELLTRKTLDHDDDDDDDVDKFDRLSEQFLDVGFDSEELLTRKTLDPDSSVGVE